MAFGPPAPSVRPVRSRPVPAARPGALLTAAAAVPLGAAVLYAAGLLDWLPRLVLGAALVVLGTAIWRTASTVTGARIGPRTSRAIGMAVVVGGAAVLGGALVAAVVDRNPDANGASLLLGAAVAAAGAWVARERPAVGGVVVALAAGVGWLLLLTVLGVGTEVEIALTVLPAFGLTLVAVRGGGSPAVRAGVGVAAALLLVPGTGELTGISLVLRGLVEPTGATDPADGWLFAQAVLSELVLAVVLATAVVRRDAVGGTLAAAILLMPTLADDGALRVAHAVIPAIALALLSGAVRSEGLRGWMTARAPGGLRERGWNVSLDVVRGAWAVSLVVLVSSLWVPDTRAQAALAVVALLAATGAAWSSRGTAASVAAAVTVVGWAAVRPITTLLGDQPWVDGSDDGDRVGAGFRVFEGTTTAAIVELAVVAAVGLALLARHRTPAVAAAVAYAVLVAGAAASVAGLSSDGRLLRIVIGSVGLSVVPLVIAAGCAAAGPGRWLAHAQAVAAVSAGVTMVGLFALPSSVLGAVFIAAGDGLGGTVRLVLVLLLVGTALGGALLAASAARRGSVAAALGAVAAAVGTATLAATLSAALVGPSGSAGPIDQAVELFVPLAPVLGFDWHGSLLRFAEPGWPVIFGVVGVVLLATAAWLESRRPLPAGAPITPRDD